MIRSYTVSELEQMSGTTRRTISDYIAKGVLAGPSHRGRGARYPQKDLDVLTVLPRIRTLMKKEYPTLKEVSAFLDQLSVRDINKLANLPTEESFVAEVRRLRVRNSLMNLLPYMAPERIEEVLTRLTPGQIRGIDAGCYQIGAVLDIEALLQAEGQAFPAGVKRPTPRSNGEDSNTVADDTGSSWSVSWLKGHQESDGELQPANVGSPDETARRLQKIEQGLVDTTTDLQGLVAGSEDTQPELPVVDESLARGASVLERLSEIASRLQKLESMLEKA